MANKILITPGGTGQVPAGQVLVGKDYTGDLTTFNGKIFVFTDPYNPLDLPPNLHSDLCPLEHPAPLKKTAVPTQRSKRLSLRQSHR